jgi:hypothetical protein
MLTDTANADWPEGEVSNDGHRMAEVAGPQVNDTGGRMLAVVHGTRLRADVSFGRDPNR